MKELPIELGRVVISTQGRDKGRPFVIVSLVSGDLVLIADGDTRRIAKPKLKKLLHLHVKPVLLTELAEPLNKGQAVEDSQLRKALAQAGFKSDKRPCKEDCALV